MCTEIDTRLDKLPLYWVWKILEERRVFLIMLLFLKFVFNLNKEYLKLYKKY